MQASVARATVERRDFKLSWMASIASFEIDDAKNCLTSIGYQMADAPKHLCRHDCPAAHGGIKKWEMLSWP